MSGDGHFFVALDYRANGPQGEPSFAWIDVEVHEDLTIAPNFRAFVEGLVPTTSFPEDPDLDLPVAHIARPQMDRVHCG